MEATARLENWTKAGVWVDEFIIFGEIFDDKKKRWTDGTQIKTSAIKNRECKKGDIVTTRNNTYKLGNERVK